ncbi:MAG: hypothetical protein LBU99_01290 [Spirochaetaceae bacterium]|jgi:hypothetical protein|nr:hypothetical protein [Spirochaetaceae bacterium]
MKNMFKLLGIIVIAAVIGFMVVGCGGGNTLGGDGDNTTDNTPSTTPPTENPPQSSGVNAVSGKTYYQADTRTVFSATAEGAVTGTYTVGQNDGDTDTNGKYVYEDIVKGSYTWNETAKTVTLTPTEINVQGSFITKSAYLTAMQEMLAETRAALEAMSQDELMEALGNTDIDAYMDVYTEQVEAMVDDTFAVKTAAYSFSTDNTALFLVQSLQANKGTNELAGKTYYDAADENITFVFTADTYTYTDSANNRTISGSYTYDSEAAMGIFRPETMSGMTRAQIYTEMPAPGPHSYADDNAYLAALINGQFAISYFYYDSVNLLIHW